MVFAGATRQRVVLASLVTAGHKLLLLLLLLLLLTRVRFQVNSSGISAGFHVSTFHTWTFREEFARRDSPPRPSIDAQRSLRSERGTPRLRAHALPSNPCRPGWQGMGKADRQYRRQGGRQKTNLQNAVRGESAGGILPGNCWFNVEKGGTDPSRDENSGS